MESFQPFLDRFFMMLDGEQQKKILSARVLLFGVGGVGSALAEFLVRSGISNLTIVDFDDIDVTNINRQLVAFQDNVGRKKVEELSLKLKNINPNLNIKEFPIRLNQDTINQFNLKVPL